MVISDISLNRDLVTEMDLTLLLTLLPNPGRFPREKGRDLTQSYDKIPYTNRNVKRATQTTPQKRSITERLRTDLRRSVGVTMATHLLWLTWLTG